MTRHLPIVGSSAATTAFCAEALDGPGDLRLWFDGNSKITRDNGTYAAPRPNAFSLLAASVEGEDARGMCPYSTPTCRSSCYVKGLADAAPDTYALYKHNSSAILAILASWHLGDDWAVHVGEWIREHAAGGFRWHVSGDVFSENYAEWIHRVAWESGDVPHWIYTRSFKYVPTLLGPPNLTVNLSCDKDNYAAARDCRDRAVRWHARPLTLCYLVESSRPQVPDDLPAGSVIFPDYDLRPRGVEDPTAHPWWGSLTVEQRKMVCPVDAFGKSEALRCGPCKRCL